MIVSQRYKCVYMPPGKTGSTSVRTALEMMGGDPIIWGHSKYGKGTKWKHNEEGDITHSCHLPEEFSDYYIFGSVRNPYTRHISRYLHVVTTENRPPTQYDFELFVKEEIEKCKSCYEILNLREDYIPPTGCAPFKIHALIRTETLGEDFNRLPFVKKQMDFPHRYQNPNPGLFFTKETAQILQKYHIKDFETFGYSKESPLIKKSITQMLAC